jgi:hypothetical protein
MLEAQEPKYDVIDGRIVNRKTGEPIPDDEPIMIFRAKDQHAHQAIAYYIECCANAEHQEIVARRLDDFRRFGNDHLERMKEPD